MASELDPTVKYNLQHHLIYAHHRQDSHPLKLGTPEQLSVAAKISDNKKLRECFDWRGDAIAYPDLPERSYLIACVDRFINVQVFAIYTVQQMNRMQEERGSGCVNGMDWKVLEIPEDVESELLKDVNLELGSICTTIEAIGGTY